MSRFFWTRGGPAAEPRPAGDGRERVERDLIEIIAGMAECVRGLESRLAAVEARNYVESLVLGREDR